MGGSLGSLLENQPPELVAFFGLLPADGLSSNGFKKSTVLFHACLVFRCICENIDGLDDFGFA